MTGTDYWHLADLVPGPLAPGTAAVPVTSPHRGGCACRFHSHLYVLTVIACRAGRLSACSLLPSKHTHTHARPTPLRGCAGKRTSEDESFQCQSVFTMWRKQRAHPVRPSFLSYTPPTQLASGLFVASMVCMQTVYTLQSHSIQIQLCFCPVHCMHGERGA